MVKDLKSSSTPVEELIHFCEKDTTLSRFVPNRSVLPISGKTQYTSHLQHPF